MPVILQRLEVNESDPTENAVLVLIISLVTANLRSLHVSSHHCPILFDTVANWEAQC